MKKIVALVLSLVMALSLCTVAFGVQDVVYAAADGKVYKNQVCYTAFDTVKAHTDKNGGGNVEYYVAKDVTVYDTYYQVKFSDGDVRKVGTDGNQFLTYKAAEKFAKDNFAEWLAADDARTYEVETYEVESVVDVMYLIPCVEDEATCALYKNGRLNTWLFETTDVDLAFYSLTGKAQSATTAKPNCTTDQFFEDGYIGDDDCFYVAVDYVSEIRMKVDGKIVFVEDKCYDTDYVIWASHVFAKGVKNDKTGYDVAKCLICGGEFACTNSAEVATNSGYKISTMFAYSSDRAANVYDENAYENGYDFTWGQAYAGDYDFVWQLKAGTTEEIGTATETETKTEGVESAKTFDAGIAMYVGMSLMSVAGTAVVIGKKKEF